uniref:Uncharacterized protein n=1 Tax=Timema cristinae TaxID=61476 RepID=A0A7R9GVX9_TIMCR|nr:unnamed protein product [Timema cristinae]
MYDPAALNQQINITFFPRSRDIAPPTCFNPFGAKIRPGQLSAMLPNFLLGKVLHDLCPSTTNPAQQHCTSLLSALFVIVAVIQVISEPSIEMLTNRTGIILSSTKVQCKILALLQYPRDLATHFLNHTQRDSNAVLPQLPPKENLGWRGDGESEQECSVISENVDDDISPSPSAEIMSDSSSLWCANSHTAFPSPWTHWAPISIQLPSSSRGIDRIRPPGQHCAEDRASRILSGVELAPCGKVRSEKNDKRVEDELVPVMTFLPSAPEKLLHLICCGCKKGCECNCECKKSELAYNVSLFGRRSVPAFLWIVETHFGKTALRTPDRNSNLDLLVIDSLDYCKSSVLDHAATESGNLPQVNSFEVPYFQHDQLPLSLGSLPQVRPTGKLTLLEHQSPHCGSCSSPENGDLIPNWTCRMTKRATFKVVKTLKQLHTAIQDFGLRQSLHDKGRAAYHPAQENCGGRVYGMEAREADPQVVQANKVGFSFLPFPSLSSAKNKKGGSIPSPKLLKLTKLNPVTRWPPLPNRKPQHLLPGVFPFVSFNTGDKGSKRQGLHPSDVPTVPNNSPHSSADPGKTFISSALSSLMWWIRLKPLELSSESTLSPEESKNSLNSNFKAKSAKRFRGLAISNTTLSFSPWTH